MRRACETYRQKLHDRMTCMGLSPEAADRMKTAVATQRIVGRVSAAEPPGVVGLLAQAETATSEAAMGECVGRAAELEGNLGTAGWDSYPKGWREQPVDTPAALAVHVLGLQAQDLGAEEHTLQSRVRLVSCGPGE